MKPLKYREMKCSGKCKQCGINLWAEHDNKPAPTAMPCGLENCPHKSDAKVLPFLQSQTGSSIAQI